MANINKKDAGDTILDYAVTTNPDPIQASPAQGNSSLTALTIAVANTSLGRIYCRKLTFSFEIGGDASQLTASADGIMVAASPADKWRFGAIGDGTFPVSPLSSKDQLITTDGMVFQIHNIQANPNPGVFMLYIDEESSSDGTNFTRKSTSISLGKFPNGFYVRNFAASQPQVNDNQTVDLTWDGSALGAYDIHYGEQTVNVTNRRAWTSPPLRQNTTFELRATDQDLGETASISQYVTVIVNQPDIQCTSLTATDLITGIGMVPPGCIAMQSGSLKGKYEELGAGIAGTPYQGWQLCNGHNKSPNLTARFIVGADATGGEYTVGATGGQASIRLNENQKMARARGVTEPGHSRSDPLHVHAEVTDNDDHTLAIDASGGASMPSTAESKTGAAIAKARGYNIFDNRPPYYALYFIIRTEY